MPTVGKMYKVDTFWAPHLCSIKSHPEFQAGLLWMAKGEQRGELAMVGGKAAPEL